MSCKPDVLPSRHKVFKARNNGRIFPSSSKFSFNELERPSDQPAGTEQITNLSISQIVSAQNPLIHISWTLSSCEPAQILQARAPLRKLINEMRSRHNCSYGADCSLHIPEFPLYRHERVERPYQKKTIMPLSKIPIHTNTYPSPGGISMKTWDAKARCTRQQPHPSVPALFRVQATCSLRHDQMWASASISFSKKIFGSDHTQVIVPSWLPDAGCDSGVRHHYVFCISSLQPPPCWWSVGKCTLG